MSFLTLDDIHTFYGASYVLHGVSLTVPEGQVAALLGRNGAGKTTTIRSIFGFTPPRRGDILFRGEVISRKPPYAIAARGIGLVPQGRRIFRSLNVDEHLHFGPGRSSGASAWTPERVFALFPRLKERRYQLAGTLSGGEQSMLAIARALLLNPSLLLMDEPTEGLAPVVVDVLMEAIRTLKQEGQTILLVEQDLSLALELADRVYVMSKGQIVFAGSSAELEGMPNIQSQYLGV
jgi:branched-chain amino acid transport system ATP-binding protein